MALRGILYQSVGGRVGCRSIAGQSPTRGRAHCSIADDDRADQLRCMVRVANLFRGICTPANVRTARFPANALTLGGAGHQAGATSTLRGALRSRCQREKLPFDPPNEGASRSNAIGESPACHTPVGQARHNAYLWVSGCSSPRSAPMTQRPRQRGRWRGPEPGERG